MEITSTDIELTSSDDLTELDVLIDLRQQTSIINPKRPERGSSILKGSRSGEKKIALS
jgi:hypothetical protein